MKKLQLIEAITNEVNTIMGYKEQIEKRSYVQIPNNADIILTGKDLLSTFEMLENNFYNATNSTINRKFKKDQLVQMLDIIETLEIHLQAFKKEVANMEKCNGK